MIKIMVVIRFQTILPVNLYRQGQFLYGSIGITNQRTDFSVLEKGFGKFGIYLGRLLSELDRLTQALLRGVGFTG